MGVPDEKDEEEKGSANWQVRDSWVEEVPGMSAQEIAAAVTAAQAARDAAEASTAPVKSIPPPLPASEARLPEDDSTARAELMFERLAANDHEGALLVAQSILAKKPHDQDALECAEMAARELWKLNEKRLGGLDRVPVAMVTPDALPPTLNLRAGFLLARVDGIATVHEIVNRAGLPLIDALRGLAELYLCGAIKLEQS